MSARKASVDDLPHWPRLLTVERAAAYCDMTTPTFKSVCPIRPIALRDRLKRYDRRDLDQWLDSLRSGDSVYADEDWLSRLG